jgi:hypothetical protein
MRAESLALISEKEENSPMKSSSATADAGIVVAIEGSRLRLVATDIRKEEADILIQGLEHENIDSAFFPVTGDKAKLVLETLNSSQCLHNFLA